MNPLRILITNDDGINAPGIAVLERVARKLSDDVWIVAPDFERSGASRSISLAEPIRVRQIDERRYSLMRGTPTDCVAVAVNSIMQDTPPTLILSGINRGANLGGEMTYSGTVAGAMEGASLGMRAICMSQVFAHGAEVRWHTAERYAERVIRALLDLQVPPGVFHNINFPDVEPEQVRGLRVSHQGRWSVLRLKVHERIDARNFPYAWLSLAHEVGEQPHDSDLGAAHSGHISVTPLHADLTHHASLEPLRRGLSELKLD
jgi:5'-nucleotidase